MANLAETENWVADRLPVPPAEHGVPGATIAVSADGEVIDHAAGVLNTGTGVEATPDSLFQVGSTTEAAAVTVRQLTCQPSGFEGDLFADTGKGDDCVEKYVATLGDVEQLFGPGEMLSYNNAAFRVLGRVVEVLRDRPSAAWVSPSACSPRSG